MKGEAIKEYFRTKDTDTVDDMKEELDSVKVELNCLKESDKMIPIAMEETLKTTRWPLRLPCFLMAVTEVNCWLVLTNIDKQQEWSQQDFRKELSGEFLQNEYL